MNEQTTENGRVSDRLNSLVICPTCGCPIEPIGCEKTTFCNVCGSEWKNGEDGELVEVEENDPIYLDR